jgi:hypothetical protein
MSVVCQPVPVVFLNTEFGYPCSFVPLPAGVFTRARTGGLPRALARGIARFINLIRLNCGALVNLEDLHGFELSMGELRAGLNTPA